jgi:hypothetical protein|tara:strand:+ start:110 stop:286 length:177 start_codon:yes stop_codon:yes gene_type:complete
VLNLLSVKTVFYLKSFLDTTALMGALGRAEGSNFWRILVGLFNKRPNEHFVQIFTLQA